MTTLFFGENIHKNCIPLHANTLLWNVWDWAFKSVLLNVKCLNKNTFLKQTYSREKSSPRIIKWQMATLWMCEVNNSLSSNNNSKQIHTNPLLTFRKFLFPCAWNSGCHTHTHTVRHPDPLLGPPQYVTIPLFCPLKEVISSNSARAPFITTTVPSLLVPVSTFLFF